MEPFTLRKPTDKEFKQICLFITEFELDNRDLKKEQFIVAIHNSELVGFGRLREHADCLEICSLGVVTSYRRQGIGRAIVAKLIEKISKNIYLVSIIPDFFIPFGFQKVENFPISIRNKIEYCTSELVVPEAYVAMLLSPK
ncbi:MAG: GNAT family N-acetyltransferase [Bacteroidota bacterium]